MSKNNLLLLHGALGSQKQFDRLKNLLVDDFNVFTFNFEGHGGRESDSTFSMDLFGANVLEFMSDNDLDRTHMFGYSMGGYVALKLALKQPERISSIMTLGTKFNWSEEAAQKEVRMLDPATIEAKVPKFAQHLMAIHQPEDWKLLLHKTAEMMLGLARGERLKIADLQRIRHDVLIGIGSLDKMVTMEESKNAAEQIPNGNCLEIEGVHHPLEKNNPEQLAKYILDFFN